MTEITDEMVDRLLSASMRMQKAGDRNPREEARYMLDAALNFPAPPEVEVTAEMTQAGGDAYWKSAHADKSAHERYAASYRAMHAARPKEPEPALHLGCRTRGCLIADATRGVKSIIPMYRFDGGLFCAHRRKGDTPHDKNHYHRRAGDPK